MRLECSTPKRSETGFRSWSPTSDGALAGISSRCGTNSIRRGGDVVSAVPDDDGVAARAVRNIRHAIRPVPAVFYTGLFGFSVLVLMEDNREKTV